jgi:hypothetical protein
VGEAIVTWIAYRAPGAGNLHPADAALNLPEETALARAAQAGRPRIGARLVRSGWPGDHRATGILVGKR